MNKKILWLMFPLRTGLEEVEARVLAKFGAAPNRILAKPGYFLGWGEETEERLEREGILERSRHGPFAAFLATHVEEELDPVPEL